MSEIEKEENADESDVEETDVTPVTFTEVQDCIQRMKDFALQRGLTSVLTNVMDLDSEISEIMAKTKTVQPKIMDFFKQWNLFKLELLTLNNIG